MLLRVGLLGYGRVGQAVATVAERSRARIESAGVEIEFASALVRDLSKPRQGPPMRLSRDAESVLSGVDVVVEVLGGIEPAWTLVESALRARIPVVSANKTLVARYGQELLRVAAQHGATFVFDAAVLAGVPFLGSLSRRPLISQARHLAGIVNGTSQFIVSELDRGASFELALAEAVTRGYAEPDSSADTSGRDAAEKLAILLHLAGYPSVAATELPRTQLEVLDPAHLAVARRLGGAVKPVAFAAIDAENPGAWVGPAFVDQHHVFASLGGVANAIEIRIGDDHTVTFAGPGAGPEVTAVTILDDIVEAVSGERPTAARSSDADRSERSRLPANAFCQPPAGAWFLGEAATGRGTITPRLDWPTVQASLEARRAEGANVIALPVIGERCPILSCETSG